MSNRQVHMNYKNGKIYKVVSDSTDSVYVGSTCSPLSVRMAGHRSSYRKWLANSNKKRGYYTSFDVLKNEDCHIVLLETYACNNKDELFARERHWIDITENTVNKFIPGRTEAEYYADNKIKILEYKKDYYEDNKTKIIERMRGYYKNNRETILKKNHCFECNGKYTVRNKSQHTKTPKHQNSYIATIKREFEQDQQAFARDMEKFNALPVKLNL